MKQIAIGTPLSPSAIKVMLLGSGELGKEVSPRPHDTGMVAMCTQRLNEFELHVRAIPGLPVDASLRATGAQGERP